MAAKPALSSLYFIFGLLQAATGDKVAQKIYQDLTGIMPCVILTNATNQIGCTSSINGHVGVLHYVQDESDVRWILENGPHSPYVPLFRSDQFNLKLLRPLIENKKISGALIIAVQSGKYRYTPKTVYSPDYECPSDNFGAYSGNPDYGNCQKVTWNNGGNAMSFKYYDIPMFALNNEKEIDDLIECYNEHNSPDKPDYPLCGVQLKDFMYAAKDTPTCMRKTHMPNPTDNDFCQPLGDQNVWGTLYTIKEPLKEREVVMLATKLDSSSFFHDLTPGVDNDGTGIIVALAAAKQLGAWKRNGSVPVPKNPIMFTFFQGESWDYIGSSRMVYDMEHNDFPADSQTWKVGSNKNGTFKMKLTNIKYFIELNQVGLIEDGEPLWAHSDPLSLENNDTKSQVHKLITTVQRAASNYKLDIKEPSKGGQPLPPASFQRFLRSTRTIPGIVLTDHEDKYKNKFYNSHFDDLYQVQGNFSKENDTVYLITKFTKKLAKITATVARALYTLANDGEPPKDEVKVDNDTEALIGHLTYCLFVRSNCPLYSEVFNSKTWDSYKKLEKPFPRHVSVNGTGNLLTSTVYYLLLYFTGYWPLKGEKCSASEGEVKTTMQGKDPKGDGICVVGSVYVSPALSPAFLLEKYDSTEYSTWAESTWRDDLTVRLFLIASPQLEGATLGAGLFITIFSFGLVFFLNKKADKLFTPTNPLSGDNDSQLN